MARKPIETVNAGGGTSIELEGLGDILRLFNKLKPSFQRRIYRSAGSKAGTVVKKTARRLAPKGHGKRPNGQPRKHLRDTLIQNTKTLRTGSVSTVIGADYRITPHMHWAHQGAAPATIGIKNKRVLSNFATAAPGTARFFGVKVKIKARKGKPFLKDALEANKSQIEAIYTDAIRKTVSAATS